MNDRLVSVSDTESPAASDPVPASITAHVGPDARFDYAIPRSVLLFTLCALLAVVSGFPHASEPGERAPGSAPDILLIVVDDMGYSDIGAFGGEIATPNLDQLAFEGVRFSDFQVLPACSPTRAALLTGREPHAVGFGTLAEEVADNQRAGAAYRGVLPADVPTLPGLLRHRGYQTFMSGKWHLGFDGGRGPRHFGFDRSVALLDGGASHFADMKPAYSPDPQAVARYVVNDRLIEKLPDNFEYSSQFWADALVEMLDDADPERPIFAYLSFTAPHWPLQAPDAAIEAYKDRYREGWDVLRSRRLSALQSLGLVSDTAVAAPAPPNYQPWKELGEAERARAARAMSVYAAMVAEVDRHVGRVMASLEASGRLDNALIVFLSDNGAEGHDLDETWSADLFPEIRAVIDQRFDHSTAQMGRPNSYTLYGPGWAYAAAPHLRLYKGFPTEGGTRVTAFMAGAALGRTPSRVHRMVSVRDLMPTLLDISGTNPPPEITGELAGRSLLPLLREEHDVEERTLAIEFLGKQAVRRGRWKLVKLPVPYGAEKFTLYDLVEDPGEAVDVASGHPEVVAALKAAYQRYARDFGVIDPDWVSGY